MLKSADRKQELPATQTDLPSIPQLFSRYTARTDGKELLAQGILAAIPAEKRGLLVDLGSGDGKLAANLAPHFEANLLIDKNLENKSALEQIPKSTVIVGRMEQSLPVPQFDVALMSYSLSGVPDTQCAEFLTRLFQCRGPNGRVLFASFRDDCDWDQFTTPIYRELGRSRNGGVEAHKSLIQAAGFTVEHVASIDTEIFDETLPELLKTLGFFFAPVHQAYFENLPRFEKSLESHARERSYGGVALRCVEEIWEIKG